MRRIPMIAILVGIAAVVASFAAADGPADKLTSATALDPDRSLEVSQQAIGRTVGNHRLIASTGETVVLNDLRGKALVISLVYTSCTHVCPMITQRLRKSVEEARRMMGPDRFTVVTVGFDARNDTPMRMAAYARAQGVDLPNWKFFSGDNATISALAKDLGFTYVASGGGYLHISQITIVDRDGRIYRQVYGDTFSIWLLIDPLKELIEGTPVPVRSLGDFLERVRILCTVYDPRTNTYRFKTTVIGEVVSFVAITIAIAWFVWFERRRRRKASAR